MFRNKVFNSQEPVEFYDPAEIYDYAIKHLIDIEYCSDKDDAMHCHALSMVVQEYSEMRWLNVEENMRAVCDKYLKKGAGLICPAFSWHRSPVANNFETDALKALKQAYLDAECSLKVYLKRNHLFGVHLQVVVCHHDSSPTGDDMFIVGKKYHERFIQKHFG